jgi:hypothetical protein
LAKKPIEGEPARSGEAELTPTQKKRRERDDMIRKIGERQKRYGERPDDPDENNFIVTKVQYAYERLAAPAYDDMPSKRRKVIHAPKAMRQVRLAPRKKDVKPVIEKIPSLPDGLPQLDQGPIVAMGIFATLPAEIRDEILRYTLLWPQDIAVFSGWSRVFPRSRPHMDLSILYTCQVLRHQGLRILFGENTFVYDLRDPAASDSDTKQVLESVFAKSVVPINEYGHLMRHVKIKANRNRLHCPEHRQNFENAILKFLPGHGLVSPPNLHTLTLEVPAVSKEDLNELDWEDGPHEVPIWEYLQKDSIVMDALFKIRLQFLRVVARDKYDQCWEAVLDLRYYAKDEQMRLEYAALSKDGRKNTADGADDPAARPDYRPKDIEAMEKLWDHRVEKTIVTLHDLAWRIEGLAIAPDPAVDELGLWTPVTAPDPKDRSTLLSLPSNWREPPYHSTRSSMRTRSMSVTSLASEAPKKKKRKPKTKTKAYANPKKTFGARDLAKQAPLLQAQKCMQEESETELGAGGMLTVGRLASLSNEDSTDTQGSTDGDETDTDTMEIEAPVHDDELKMDLLEIDRSGYSDELDLDTMDIE